MTDNGIKTMRILVAAVLTASLILPVTTTSADAIPRLVRIWCKKDYKRFCPRYKVNSARMRACMSANRNHLSPVCKKALIDTGYARRYGYR